jgi:hypothetical protein
VHASSHFGRTVGRFVDRQAPGAIHSLADAGSPAIGSPTFVSETARTILFEVETLFPRIGVVMVRALEKVNFEVAPGCTLRGCRLRGFDQPRMLPRPDGSERDIYGMFLEDPADVASFEVGETVLLESPGTLQR